MKKWHPNLRLIHEKDVLKTDNQHVKKGLLVKCKNIILPINTEITLEHNKTS